MNRRFQLEFVLLAALWGASFLFMRIAAPEFGPMPLMLVRCLVGAVVLLPIALAREGGGGLARAARAASGRLFVAGIFNSAIPFVMFGYAALALNAGFSSILNATAPIFGAIIAYAWLKERLSGWRIAGLAIGIAGVVVLSWDKASFRGDAAGGWAVLACLVATFCYGIAGNFVRRHLGGTHPLLVATGSQLAATLVLSAPGIAAWPQEPPSAASWACAITLGSACTGLAYVLFFRLIANVSASAALSVTYLIPLFGIAWGWLFLGETVDLPMLAGGAIVVLGTALATGMLRPGVSPMRAARRTD